MIPVTTPHYRWREVLYALDLEDELTKTPQLDRESLSLISDYSD